MAKAKGSSKQQRKPAAPLAVQKQPLKQSANGTQQPPGASKPHRRKERVLVLSSRGTTARYRHLMTDLQTLLPHSKKDVKVDTKADRGVINEAADMKGCTSALFFEARKRQDLYLWLARTPAGPTAKFLVQNVHTMDELKLTGNHLRGSRPVLSFDASFDDQPHLQLVRELLTRVFATPPRHHKSKPFFDHVLSFSIADNRVWFRNYQVVMPADGRRPDPSKATLVEVGPRLCLNPIRIFEGSFGGRVLYENTAYTPPNAIRRLLKQQKAGKYATKVAARSARRDHVAEHPMPEDEVGDVFRRST